MTARPHVGPQYSHSIVEFGGTVTLIRVAPRRLDSDNLASSLKAIRDGIADALGIDDGDLRLQWIYAQEKCRKGQEGVRVVVGAVEAR